MPAEKAVSIVDFGSLSEESLYFVRGIVTLKSQAIP